MPINSEVTTSFATNDRDLVNAPSFIERQFPVAKISMESYKERSSKQSQTLTGFGKWWGRKPLVLVRATILGLLLPATDDAIADRDIFLSLMMMDDEGVSLRKKAKLPVDRLIQCASTLEKERYFTKGSSVWKSDAELAWISLKGTNTSGLFVSEPDFENQNIVEGPRKSDTTKRMQEVRKLAREVKEAFEQTIFLRLPYSEKLQHCLRPEQVDGPSVAAWRKINRHLGIDVGSLPELIAVLGMRRFGRIPVVGDSFSGSGAIPFESARLGCDVRASDLNPVAGLLTWSALNIINDDKTVHAVKDFQQSVFERVNREVLEFGIEHNRNGWRADAFLYCVEVRDSETGWMIPLAPNWVVGEKPITIAKLVPDKASRRFHIEIEENPSEVDLTTAKETGTVKDFRFAAPGATVSTPLGIFDPRIRRWESDDIEPQQDDVFQERLFCIRWVEEYYEHRTRGTVLELSKAQAEALPAFSDLLDSGELKHMVRRHFRAIDDEDLELDNKVRKLLAQRLPQWRKKGLLPTRPIEPGKDINRPTNARGWTYWHHFFNPRQLLVNGLFAEASSELARTQEEVVTGLLATGCVADWNSRQCRWHTRKIGDKSEQTFYKPSLSTPLFTYCCRGLLLLETTFLTDVTACNVVGSSVFNLQDARTVTDECDLWITDPPYADAVNYHELSEYFLAWYDKRLRPAFPSWYSDSKRALAIRGDNPQEFRKSMVDCYRRLADHMPDNGMQVVMFTHQDAGIWADLTMILWAAGLRVTGAWCIATETDSTLKKGNFVQGTVLLACRKRIQQEAVFLDEINHRVESEVRSQLDSMLALDDASDPNFADADYQLAAYAAALRILTERPIEEIDPEREVLRVRTRDEPGIIEELIRNAVKIACDHLVPAGIDGEMWRTLSPMERFYLKSLEVESHGERRGGVYQELARGFGATDYSDLMASTRANETRLKTASEFARKMLSTDGFGSSLVRHALFAVHQVSRSEQTSDGLNWMKTELPDYWNSREKIIHILDFLGSLDRVGGMDHWKADAESARLLSGTVRNDHV